MEQEEIWRDIEGYEGLYQVSNLGRVKSIGYGKERILRPKMKNDGYLEVGLHKEVKRKIFRVHRLVAQAFIPNPEGLTEINHRDEDKTNNLVGNLEYCDRKYNVNYGTRTERAVQTGISNGKFDPEMCGIIKNKGRKEYKRLQYQKNREKELERNREQYQKNREKRIEYQREYRLKKKQEKKKDNHPSEVSLW